MVCVFINLWKIIKDYKTCLVFKGRSGTSFPKGKDMSGDKNGQTEKDDTDKILNKIEELEKRVFWTVLVYTLYSEQYFMERFKLILKGGRNI